MSEGDESPGTTHWRSLHLWQIQPIRDGLLIAAVIGILMLGYELSIVTVPLLLAMALAYLFEPLVRIMTRRGWVSRPGVALGVIVIAFILVVVPTILGVGFAIVQGISYTRQIVSNVQALQQSVEQPDNRALFEALPPGAWRSIRDYVVEARQEPEPQPTPPAPTPQDPAAQPAPSDAEKKAVEPAPDGSSDAAIEEPEPEEDRELPPAARDVVRESTAWLFHLLQANADSIGRFVGRQALGTGADAARAALRAFTSTGYLVFTGFLTAFFFYFFCTGYGRLLSFWEGLIPERKKGRIVDLLGKMDRVIAGFIRGRLTICASLMVYFTVAYWLIGTPAPLILGPVVGLLSLLPYVAGLGMPVAALLMWLQPASAGWQSEWWWVLGGPILVSVGSQVLDDYVLTPAIQGKSTGMDTPTIVFASIAGGALAGVYGLLLAIPVAACIKIMLREVVWPKIRAWAEGRSNDPLPFDTLGRN